MATKAKAPAPAALWEGAEALLGEKVANLTVSLVGAKSATLTRENGKTLKVSRKMVEGTYQRLLQGEALHWQASRPNGGISYTVAITRAVIAFLGPHVKTRPDGRFVLGEVA